MLSISNDTAHFLRKSKKLKKSALKYKTKEKQSSSFEHNIRLLEIQYILLVSLLKLASYTSKQLSTLYS